MPWHCFKAFLMWLVTIWKQITMASERETLQWNTGKEAMEKLQATPMLAGPISYQCSLGLGPSGLSIYQDNKDYTGYGANTGWDT